MGSAISANACAVKLENVDNPAKYTKTSRKKPSVDRNKKRRDSLARSSHSKSATSAIREARKEIMPPELQQTSQNGKSFPLSSLSHDRLEQSSSSSSESTAINAETSTELAETSSNPSSTPSLQILTSQTKYKEDLRIQTPLPPRPTHPTLSNPKSPTEENDSVSPTIQTTNLFKAPWRTTPPNGIPFSNLTSPTSPTISLTSPSQKTPSSRNRPHYLSGMSTPTGRNGSSRILNESINRMTVPKRDNSMKLSPSDEMIRPSSSSTSSSSARDDTSRRSSLGRDQPIDRSPTNTSSSQNFRSQTPDVGNYLSTEFKTPKSEKRRHSLFAGARDSPSLINEAKQSGLESLFDPNFSFGQKSNTKQGSEYRRYSEFPAPLSPTSPTLSPFGPIGPKPTRRRSISIAPSHQVEMTTRANVGRDQQGRKTINQYTVIKKLGKGTYGSVKLGKNEVTGELVALKVINKSLINNIKRKFTAPGKQQSNQISKIKHEIAILKKLDHPNVVRLLEVIDDPMDDKICLAFEYIDGGEIMSLTDEGTLAPGQKPFSEDEARFYFRQLLNGLEFLHNNRVVHRDIKPSNILITKNKEVKLSDFGVSKLLEDDEEDMLDDSQGTPAFLPPEACYKGKIQGRPADIWALGVTLYCMVFGELPFRSDEQGASKLLYLFYIITHEDPIIPRGASNELSDILKRMLEKNVKTRITMEELQEHPWVTNNENSSTNEDVENNSLLPRLDDDYPIFDFSENYLGTYKQHAQLRKIHSRRTVVVDSSDINNAIKEKEYSVASLLNLNQKPKKNVVRRKSSAQMLFAEVENDPKLKPLFAKKASERVMAFSIEVNSPENLPIPIVQTRNKKMY